MWLVQFFQNLLDELLVEMPDLILYVFNAADILHNMLNGLLVNNGDVVRRVVVDREAPQFQQFLNAHDDLHGAAECLPRVTGHRSRPSSEPEDSKQTTLFSASSRRASNNNNNNNNSFSSNNNAESLMEELD